MSTDQSGITLVVGAGPAGLTAAWKLAEAGEKCLLVEKDDCVGGMCRSYDIDGITFDLGPHLFFHNPDAAPEQLMYELLENEEVLFKKSCYSIFVNGKQWKQPFKPWHPLLFPSEYRRDFFRSRLSKGHEMEFVGESLAYSLAKTIGYSCYRDLYDPLLLKKTHVPGQQLHRDWLHRADRSLDHCREERPDISPIKVIQHLLRIMLFSRYYYPVKGFGIFAEKLWEKYKTADGETILNCGPIDFEIRDKRVVNAVIKERSYPIKNMVWTGSANELNSKLGDQALKAEYVDTLVVCATFNRDRIQPRPYVYTYYPQKDVCFNRLYFPESIYGRKFPQGHEGVCAEINEDNICREGDERGILERVCSEFETLNLFKKSQLREYRLFRLRDCMPIHKLNYETKLQEIFRTTGNYENIYAVGRKGGYFFCQTPAAVSQGLKVASRILGSKVETPRKQ